MTILVTGSAGFIGFHTTLKLLQNGENVIGLDNFNDYYDPALKEARNQILEKNPNYKLYRGDLADLNFLKKVLDENNIEKICHLAAQAGVRYSLTNPHVYSQANLTGFVNLLEEAKNHGIKNFIYASSSSVYGNNSKVPFSVTDSVDRPISLYAASKKANELIAYTYHHLYNLNCTGLRFFTVYGPWGRPDMAYFSFTRDILDQKPIKVFNHGQLQRDFTYIDDIVAGILASLNHCYPYEIFNLGNNKPVELGRFISIIEKELGQEALKEYLPMQPGDVLMTCADIDYSQEKLGYNPKTTIEEGIKKFVNWYKEYYLLDFKPEYKIQNPELRQLIRQVSVQIINIFKNSPPVFQNKIQEKCLELATNMVKSNTDPYLVPEICQEIESTLDIAVDLSFISIDDHYSISQQLKNISHLSEK
ncbi:MAG: NAD-dependent epimerase/dehydratase family protein [Patescibacteria group bacterium]